MSGTAAFVFVERLGGALFLRWVLCRILRRAPLGHTQLLWVIYEVSPTARFLVKCLRPLGWRGTIRELEYDFFDDVRLPGVTSSLEEFYVGGPEPQLRYWESDPRYWKALARLVRSRSHLFYLHAFASKQAYLELTERLRSILVVAWALQRNPSETGQGTLVVPQDDLFELQSRYAQRWGIHLEPIPAKNRFWKKAFQALVIFGYRFWSVFRAKRLLRRFSQRPHAVRVAVEVYLRGTSRKKRFSTDFFWYRRSVWPEGTVMAYCMHPQDQPDSDRRRQLAAAGIEVVGKSELRHLMYSGGFFEPSFKGLWAGLFGHARHQAAVERYLEGASYDFYRHFDRWRRFFEATGVRMHVSTADHFPESEALHCAQEAVGGISVSIQRSIECEPRILRRTAVDVHFAFAPNRAESERASGSRIPQFVTAGYLMDDALKAARRTGLRLRRKLCLPRASFWVCFLDEAFGVNLKTLGGRRQLRADYQFLCERLRDDPKLGLLLKPQFPNTLPGRLGPVWNDLKQWMDSGRCILLGSDSRDTRPLPMVASAAADLTVGLMIGGTAALESSLVGKPTLLLTQGFSVELLNRLPKGEVLFDDWESLWQAVERCRTHPQDANRIGRWEAILNDLVVLRDGGTSERIQRYLTWLRDALVGGQSREEALREAARRYTQKWGTEQIAAVDGILPVSPDGEFANIPSEPAHSAEVLEKDTIHV